MIKAVGVTKDFYPISALMHHRDLGNYCWALFSQRSEAANSQQCMDEQQCRISSIRNNYFCLYAST